MQNHNNDTGKTMQNYNRDISKLCKIITETLLTYAEP